MFVITLFLIPLERPREILLGCGVPMGFFVERKFGKILLHVYTIT